MPALALVSVLGLLSLLYLLPTLRAGYSGDDIALAHARGFADYEHLSLWSAFGAITNQLHIRHGGWFPFGDLQVAFWLLQPAAPVARTVQVLFVVADIAAFALLVYWVSRSLRLAALSGIGVIVSIQLRESNDAILGMTFGIPATFLVVIFALLAFRLGVERRSAPWFLVAFTLQAVACGASEIAWMLAPAFPLLAATSSRRARYAWIFLAIPLFYILVGVALHAPPPASLRWLLHPGGRDLTRAAVDMVGALPTSYRAFEHVVRDGLTSFDVDNRFEAIPRTSILGLITVSGIFAVGFAALRRPRPLIRPKQILSLTAFAALLWFAGAVFHEPWLWQNGAVALGEADASVFVGSFGAGLTLATAVWIGLKSSHDAVALACVLGLCLLSYGNVRVNDRVVDVAQDRHETWNLVENAGRNGAFNHLPSDAQIALLGGALLPTDEASGYANLKYLLYQASGRRFRVASVADITRLERSCGSTASAGLPCKPHAEIWAILRNHAGAFVGGLTIGRYRGLDAHAFLIDRAVGFREFPSDKSAALAIAQFRTRVRGLRVLERSARDQRVIVYVERTCAPIKISSAFTPDAPTLSYGVGFEPPDRFTHYRFMTKASLVPTGDASQSWRYGQSRAALNVYPDTCGRQRLAVAGTIASARPSRVWITAQSHVIAIPASASGSRWHLFIEAVNSKRIDVTFNAPGSAAAETPGPMFDLRRFPPAHFVLSDTHVNVDNRL